jgi:hypothetical protein
MYIRCLDKYLRGRPVRGCLPPPPRKHATDDRCFPFQTYRFKMLILPVRSRSVRRRDGTVQTSDRTSNYHGNTVSRTLRFTTRMQSSTIRD